MDADREALIAAVLEHVADLGRDLTALRATPFGDVRLTRNQLEVLFVLAHSSADVTPGALATALGVTPGAITQLVDGLRTQGLVGTVPHPDDGRARIVALTDGARDQVSRFERAAVERMSPRFDRLSTVQLASLKALLDGARARDL